MNARELIGNERGREVEDLDGNVFVGSSELDLNGGTDIEVSGLRSFGLEKDMRLPEFKLGFSFSSSGNPVKVLLVAFFGCGVLRKVFFFLALTFAGRLIGVANKGRWPGFISMDRSNVSAILNEAW